MKKKRFILTLAGLVFYATARIAFPASDVAGIMKKAFDWQVAHPNRSDISWYNGTFYVGAVAAYQATGDSQYLNPALVAGKAHGWTLGRRLHHADDHCVGQSYIELYLLEKEGASIRNVQKTFDLVIADPAFPATDDCWKDRLFWWCDALFMTPPAMVLLTEATGDPRYIDFMNTHWWETTEALYDTDEHLFFRDKRDVTFWTDKGKKRFWSRGNGWVMAGLCRVLEFMPEDYPGRSRYVTLFQEMSARVVTLQQADGFWRSDLLKPDAFPDKETSGTGFFTYALAWGINQGLLSREEFLPVAQKGWIALCGAVDETGKLGWVQAMGGRPAATKQESTEPYAVGTFLLAGSEILKLDSGNNPPKHRGD